MRPEAPVSPDGFRRFGNDAKSRSAQKNPALAPLTPAAKRSPRVEALDDTLEKLSGDKARTPGGKTIVATRPEGPPPSSSPRPGARIGALKITQPVVPKVHALDPTLASLASDSERSEQLLELERSRLRGLAAIDAKLAARRPALPEADASAGGLDEGACGTPAEAAAGEAVAPGEDLRALVRSCLLESIDNGVLAASLRKFDAGAGCAGSFILKPSVGTWLCRRPQHEET